MRQLSQKNMRQIISVFGVVIIAIAIGISPQINAWTEPTLTAPNGNLAAPINVSATTQTKAGALYVTGGTVTPLIWDTDNTLYYLNPFGASQVSSIFANGGVNLQGSAGLNFSDHNGGFNMVDNSWIRATGVGNIYAPGEMQATNIRANSNLCIGGDCRTAWPAATVDTDTLATVTARGASTATYSSLTGGINTPILYDTNNTGYYVDPNGTSQFSSIYANGGVNLQGSAGLNFSDHNGGFNMVDNSWIRATGVGNIYAPGEMQATNIRANSTLCIAGDCRNSWAAGGLQLNTWQGNHYSGSDGAEYATIFYDTNNAGYYVDPSGSSRMNTLNYVDQAYIVDVRPQYMYDWNDSNYYMDFNNVSSLNDLRVNVLYDRQNPGYYVVPRATSRMNYGVYDNLYSYGWMQSPTFYDADDNTYMVNPNGGSNMYDLTLHNLCLHGDCRNVWPGTTAEADTLATVTSRGASTATYSSLTGGINTPIMYDTNNTGYYVDPASASRMSDITTTTLATGTLYDSSNSNYYVRPAGTSRLNYGVFDATYSYGASYASIFYDTNTSYYVDPSSSSRMNSLTVDWIGFYSGQQLSDERLKENIVPLDHSLDKLMRINGVSFNWKDRSINDKENIGVIAQNVEKVFPELVGTNPTTGMKTVEYGNLVAPIIESIKELVHKIDDLFAKYVDQQKQIDELRVEVEALKNSR